MNQATYQRLHLSKRLLPEINKMEAEIKKLKAQLLKAGLL
jgi:hypothetical protein